MNPLYLEVSSGTSYKIGNDIGNTLYLENSILSSGGLSCTTHFGVFEDFDNLEKLNSATQVQPRSFLHKYYSYSLMYHNKQISFEIFACVQFFVFSKRQQLKRLQLELFRSGNFAALIYEHSASCVLDL